MSHRISQKPLGYNPSAQQKTYVDCGDERECRPSASLRNPDVTHGVWETTE